ncbi:MAG: diadenylate cyclase CdaA [Lachnospiraceae bacterium]
MGAHVRQALSQYTTAIYWPKVGLIDVVEIVIVSFLVYKLLLWIKNTKAWMLLKGMLVFGVAILFAIFFQMHTILWLVQNGTTVLATAAVVVFQPELRRGLEKLGERNFFSSVVPTSFGNKEKEQVRFSEETVEDLVKAVYEMGKVKTGALIVVERAIQLTEYESTGILLDCILSSQILINIFEHNTPLHDGAIIVRGNRIVSATCYLPLSDNMMLSKELGTRHRAAVGMSEVSDALVIAVSEETGGISVAQSGELARNVTREYLTEQLTHVQKKSEQSQKLSTRIASMWKGRAKDEKDSDQ